MRRREFIAAIGSVATWPRLARAQQPAMPVVGFLGISLPDGYRRQLVALRQTLQEAGYVEGRNVAIEFRWAENRYDRLPTLAALQSAGRQRHGRDLHLRRARAKAARAVA